MKSSKTALGSVLIAVVACGTALAQQSPAPTKPATAATKAANAAVQKALPFRDREDFENATRGLVGKPESLTIKDAKGNVVWDLEAYKSYFALDNPAPDSVNASLWRNAHLNMQYGLFKVTDRIYQVRGYRDTRKAERREVKIGDGDPVVRLRMSYADAVSAENAARAELRKRMRRGRTMFYAFPGRPDVVAEGIATMQGFREGVDGDWLITRAEHYVGPNGYRCTIECEQPNVGEAGEVVDQAQAATIVA